MTVEEDGETVTVPRAAVDLLVAVLANMAAGQGVSLVPSQAELTTQQAADLMNVSRPFLVRLLQTGDIEYRLVGTHRRIKAASLLDYLRRDDAQRRKTADEVTALKQGNHGGHPSEDDSPPGGVQRKADRLGYAGPARSALR